MLITHVHTLCTHTHLPHPSCCFQNNHARGSTTEPCTLLHCLILSHHCRFSYLCVSHSCISLSDVASGEAIQDCETCVKVSLLLIDGSNQNKQSVSKILSCCVETMKPSFLTFSIAAFLFSSHLRCLVIYPTFIWALLCVWYVYRKSITATHCQRWGAEQERKKQ